LTDLSRERDYYDRQYEPLLAAPLPDQAVSRTVLLNNCADPRNPFYERRRLYGAAMDALLREPLAGLDVLDYGCGPADFGVWMATEGARVTLLDLSPRAIEVGLLRARASGVESSVRGLAEDASCLASVATASFDLVFACASLHHTLKYPGAVRELARVVRPGGRLILCETWGENPLLGAARKLRAALAREDDDQGEEIVLTAASSAVCRRGLGNGRLRRFTCSPWRNGSCVGGWTGRGRAAP